MRTTQRAELIFGFRAGILVVINKTMYTIKIPILTTSMYNNCASVGSSHSPEVLTPLGNTREDARYLYLHVALEESLGQNVKTLTERKIKIWCKSDLCVRDLQKTQVRKPKGKSFL